MSSSRYVTFAPLQDCIHILNGRVVRYQVELHVRLTHDLHFKFDLQSYSAARSQIIDSLLHPCHLLRVCSFIFRACTSLHPHLDMCSFHFCLVYS